MFSIPIHLDDPRRVSFFFVSFSSQMRLASLLSFRIALSIDNCIASIEAIPLMPVKGTEGQQQHQQQQKKTQKKTPKKNSAPETWNVEGPGTHRTERRERDGNDESLPTTEGTISRLQHEEDKKKRQSTSDSLTLIELRCLRVQHKKNWLNWNVRGEPS